MVRMDEIHAAVNVTSSRAARMWEDRSDVRGNGQLERSGGAMRELVLTWFVETQASLILHDGRFPPWFCGFISRQEAEDQLRDKTLGSFLIRLSEKASGYILSYKGKDRCRHFVINQTKDHMLVVCGDCITHSSLPELIQYFTHTPIQPFGECLTSDREAEAPSEQLYDVVHGKPHVKSGVSVQALRSLWDQRADVSLKGPPLPPKGSICRVMSFSSTDKNNISQAEPPGLKKNVPLRNSLSATLPDRALLPGTEPYGRSDKWLREMGTEGFHSQTRTCETWEHLGVFSCLNNHPPYISEFSHQSSQRRSPPDLEGDQFHSSKSRAPTPPHEPLPPLRSVSSSPVALFMEKNQPGPSNLIHTTTSALHLNPLYQTTSGVSAGHNSQWGQQSNQEPSQSSEISSTPISDPVTSDITYQDMLEHQNKSNCEHIPDSQQGSLVAQEANTYEDIPAMDSNTYATVVDLQPTQSTWGKKMHKWWKFLPDSKKK